MQSRTPSFPFGPNFNWDRQNPLTQHSEIAGTPVPPVEDGFLQLNGEFLLQLNGEKLLQLL